MAAQPVLSPRAARTRAALISAGFDLLAEKPIDAIPIDEVVAKAGVAKGSFFNHFADKQAFAEAIATEVRLELEDQIARANSGIADPIERIAGGMRVGAEFALSNPKRTAVLLRSHGSSTGLCQVLMANLIERPFGTAEANRRMADMLILGLSGLGASEDHVVRIASRLLNEDRGS